MIHKSTTILDQPRHSAWILALILASLSPLAPGAFAQTWNFTTCAQYGGYQDGEYWWITQDVWGPASGWQQCLYLDSHSYWQVVANLQGATSVGSYPHASYGVGGNQNAYGGPALNTVLNSSTPLMAAWNASYPAGDKYDFAYDIWLNGTTYEVMIWLDWNATAPIGGSPFTNTTINGINYNVYEGAGGSGPYCLSFLTQNGAMPAATNFNLCGILGWINNLQWNGGPFWQNPTLDTVQLGWEICNTYGSSDTYTMNYFNVYYGTTNAVVPTPTVEKLIWQANFDSTFPNGGGYGFSYRDGNNTATGTVSTNLTGGVGGSASLEYTVNLSSWISTPPSSYSGFGVGGTENPIPFALGSSNGASYRVYLSAKVGGVSAGVTNVPGVMDLLFLVPPGTLTPSNSAEAVVYDLNPSMTFTTNWQSYVFNNMPIGVNNGGSQALFNQYVSNVNQMQVQVAPQGNPNVATLFGYDTNNTVDIDNIKVVELVPGLAPLTVIQTNGQTQVMWADPTTGGTAQLQSATNVAGPYLDVTGAPSATASPYTVPAGTNQQFFRNVWVP